jgi:hypothetical protein
MPALDDDSATIRYIEEISEAFEVARVRTYKGYWNQPNGQPADLTIEVHDRGTDAGQLRYFVVARVDDRVTVCNAAPTLDVALSTVHWNELNTP